MELLHIFGLFRQHLNKKFLERLTTQLPWPFYQDLQILTPLCECKKGDTRRGNNDT